MVKLGIKTTASVNKRTGDILEVKSYDQQADEFKGDIRQFNAPTMICGYCSCATAEFIAQNYPQSEMTAKQLEEMVNQICDISEMKPRLEQTATITKIVN